MNKNFDAFENEVTQSPHTFTFKGEEYTFPYDLPYFTKLRMMRLYKAAGENTAVAGAELYEMLRTILGEQQLNKLESAAPSDEQGEAILKYIFDVYGDGESDSKNAQKTPRGKTQRKI